MFRPEEQNSEFESLLKDYCKIKGIQLIKSDLFSAEMMMTNMNALVKDDFFSYRLITQSFDDIDKLPKLFILQDPDQNYYLIERVNGSFISLRHHRAVNPEFVLSNKIIYSYAELKAFDQQHLAKSLVKRIPWIGLLGLVLIFFVLLIPLYSNLFNSRLVHSESVNSFLYITVIFIFFVVFEWILRTMIYNWRSTVVHRNQVFFDDLILFNIDRYKSRSIVVDWRTIERSATVMWEGVTQILIDSGTTILLFIVIMFLTGPFALILLGYYLVFVGLAIYVRFRAYRQSLETYKFESDKLLESISYVHNRSLIKFFNVPFFRERFHMMNRKNEHYRHEMSLENSRWQELIRANSFISLMVMFTVAYLAIKSGSLLITATIALMIINGRLAGSVVSAVNITFNILTNWHHAQKSIDTLFDAQFQKPTSSINVDKLEILELHRFGLTINGFEVLHDYNNHFVPGDVIGVIGPVGSGKTTLLNVICGREPVQTGAVLINGVNVGEISDTFFNQKVAYYQPGMNFMRGNLVTNMNLNYVFNEQRIVKILRTVNSKIQVTHDLLYKTDVEQLPLSNGERQKLFLMMMVEKKPEIIILDEPTSFLSHDEAQYMIEYIRTNNPQAIIFLATHDTSLYGHMKGLIQLSKMSFNSKGGIEIEVPPLNLR